MAATATQGPALAPTNGTSCGPLSCGGGHRSSRDGYLPQCGNISTRTAYGTTNVQVPRRPRTRRVISVVKISRKGSHYPGGISHGNAGARGGACEVGSELKHSAVIGSDNAASIV